MLNSLSVAWLSTNCCVTARTDHRSQQLRFPLCSLLHYLSQEWTNQQKRSFRWEKAELSLREKLPCWTKGEKDPLTHRPAFLCHAGKQWIVSGLLTFVDADAHRSWSADRFSNNWRLKGETNKLELHVFAGYRHHPKLLLRPVVMLIWLSLSVRSCSLDDWLSRN